MKFRSVCVAAFTDFFTSGGGGMRVVAFTGRAKAKGGCGYGRGCFFCCFFLGFGFGGYWIWGGGKTR